MSVQNSLAERVYYGRAAWYARSLHVDLVYTRVLAAAAMTSLFGIPTIYEAHDIPAGKMGPRYFKLLLSTSGFRRLVVISAALRQLLHQRFPGLLDGKSVIVAPDGVDLERFEDLPGASEARRLLDLKPERFTAGYTGNLYAGRGIELIFTLAQRCHQVDFLVLGGDPASVKERKQQAEQQRLANTHFVGFVNNAELPLYQAACEILLMPYQHRVAASGGGNIADFLSPLKMFEYMATGRMIISSDLPVFREILNESNAVFCDPEDKIAWQSAIERAAVDPDWRLALGKQAKQDAEQYSWRRRVRQVMMRCHT
jgi:glycosyltransferase involved in cell wall biosynthesis